MPPDVVLAAASRVAARVATLPVDPPPPEVRRRVKEILERAEFRRHQSLIERFFDWLSQFFDNTEPTTAAPSAAGWPKCSGRLRPLNMANGAFSPSV